MSPAEKISPFFGRCALVWFFVAVAGDILTNFHAIDVQLGAKHVPVAPLLLVVALVLILLGSLSILFGYHARHGAIMLFGLTAAAAVMLHDFWHIPRVPSVPPNCRLCPRHGDLRRLADDRGVGGGAVRGRQPAAARKKALER